MNLQQLRIIREAIRQDFNLTEVANALYTSQPGVSKHIRDLEDELGVEIFERRGKRLLRLTGPGQELATVVDRILVDIQNLRRIADQFANRESGHFVVATTHTQARYKLPRIIRWFKGDYPKVHLVLHQCGPREIVEMLLAGEADIGIATEALDGEDDLATFPYYSWHHAVIVPQGHPLQTRGKLTLEAIGEYPVITYHAGFTGRSHIDQAFAHAGIVPDIVLSAIDADIIKTYVSEGLGVGIIASMAFNPEQDRGLALLEADDLFPLNTSRLAVRRGAWLRGYVYAFIEKLLPDLPENAVKEAVRLLRSNSSADINL
ncbi:MAG: CysB family HTH-type transcriptional regulator [Zoogloeaceae bacterium]|jgi:LysR family cys regulon transcriptional activator|nr:CysB family HTH-type transcriptional regulator [Zoogloeaceae bacterium]